MAYRPRRFKNLKKRTYRRKPLAAKVATLAKQIRLTKPELKWHESVNTGATYNYAGTLLQPIGISQGTGDFSNRIGDEITLKSMSLRMTFTMSGTTYGQTNRVIVFQLKNNPDGGSISAASVINLIMHSPDLSTARAVMATKDYDNRSTFRILADKIFTMNYSSSPGTSAVNNYQLKYLPIRVRLPMAARKIQFQAASGSVSANEIFILVLSDTSGNQTFTSVAKFLYYDA